ncbi:MAG TPA: FAD-dependent oxidoreductase [Burkholderiales bacterium]|nr:FAD-dependent oxidoreductase [Burkholderiales bacterium]
MRVAIVGGGCAGVAAAWQLAARPEYEVHVYEKSWRLGGKGASGRDGAGRIVEHGLHVWLGFYENAFRMIRDCYAEVERKRWGPYAKGAKLPHGSFDDAFFPEPHIGVAAPDAIDDYIRDPRKAAMIWSGLLPPAKGIPGDALDEESNPFTLTNYLARCFELLKTLLLSTIDASDTPRPGEPRPEERSRLDEAVELDFAFDATRSPAVFVEAIARYLRTGVLTTAAGVLQAVTILETWLRKMNYSPQVADSALEFMEAVAAQVRKQLRDLVGVDQKLRWKTEVIDIVMTIAFGLYRDRVIFDERGLDALNHIDYRDWLLQHGATRSSVESPFITGFYELTFAYDKGDRKKPGLAAGVALRGALRMFFTYRGSMFWRMRSGMGDAVFAPLYKVLLSRNVTFHFLHELETVAFAFDKSGNFVKGLTFRVDGEPAGVDAISAAALDHFGCWPDSKRQFAPAQSGAAHSMVALEAGDASQKGFDAVIFAMGVADFVAIAERSGFFQHAPQHWSDMMVNVQTVATQAAQVWLARDLEALGWYRGSGILTALEPPFETWADMTHTLASERAWRDNLPASASAQAAPAPQAKSVAYFCGVLSNAATAKAKGGLTGIVRNNLKDLLSRGVKPLWPAAFRGKRTAAADLIGPAHVQANVTGSDRYTLSLPGTTDYRISPLDSTFRNMTIAGDWTACGLDAGCVEAAVMSGMLAAVAITGDEDAIDDIIGYDHP